uniref:Protein quiver n=1 Tax=Panagrellus redivivus TaxID=6233 RepID=A0A7E4ULV9_PANRE
MICVSFSPRILASLLVLAFISPVTITANERSSAEAEVSTAPPKSLHQHSHHHHNKHVLRVDGSFGPSQINPPTGIWCYSCVSGPLSNLSRAIFMRSLQIPSEAESRLCDDPFDLLHPTSELHLSSGPGSSPESTRRMGHAETNERWRLDRLVQPCKSSCLKAVLQSQDAKIVLRGCLTSIYQQISERDYFLSMPTIGSCDEQQHHSKYAGTSVTQTCICSSNYCNTANSIFNLYRFCLLLLPHFMILLYFAVS